MIHGEVSNIGELTSLAEAAGYTIVGSLEQRRRSDSSYQIGKGKASELAKLVKELNAEKIIFENKLKPIQAYNLAKITGVEAIDRFQLILEIFAKRASTREAVLQVQLASLRYQFPRARESVRLARMGEQPGFLGLGRYEIDVYLEAMRRQIAHIRRELKSISRKRSLHRSQRMKSGFSLVSLAGYTYAGKTTLFNKLASSFKPVDQGLFTTLTTTTRAVDFQSRNVLLTDTVGFVDRLPLFLIEAFHSTLEETTLSDVIILVVDFHEPIKDISKKLICCMDTLNEIGAHGIPVVTVFNKVDLMTTKEIDEKLTRVEKFVKNPITISAFLGLNIEELKQRVVEYLGRYSQASFSLPINNDVSSFISSLHNQVNVLYTDYKGKEIKVTIRAMPWELEKINGQIGKFGGKLLETKRETKQL